jgi:hypothetical protein
MPRFDLLDEEHGILIDRQLTKQIAKVIGARGRLRKSAARRQANRVSNTGRACFVATAQRADQQQRMNVRMPCRISCDVQSNRNQFALKNTFSARRKSRFAINPSLNRRFLNRTEIREEARSESFQ